MTLLDSVNTVVGLCGIRLKKVNKSFKAVSKIRRQCWIDKPWVCRIEERDNTIPTQSLFFFSVFGARHSSKHWFSSGSFAKRHLLHFLSLFNSEQPEKQHYTHFFFPPKKDEIEIINKNKHQHVAAADEKASKIWLMQSQEDGCGPYRRKKTWLLELLLQISPQLYDLWRKSIKIPYW